MKCPDDGTCHHDCRSGKFADCWRVRNCGPLSGVFPRDEWPKPSYRRFKFLYRIGDQYHWESRGRVPGDSRVEHVWCNVDWFWSTRGGFLSSAR